MTDIRHYEIGISQVNLLTNSSFGVWSNSEDLYVAVTSGGSTVGDVPCTTNVCVGRGLAPNNSATTPTGDTEADTTTGWTNVGFGQFESVNETSEPDGTYSLHLTAIANSDRARMDTVTVEIGKLYELNIVYKTLMGDSESALTFALGTSSDGSEYVSSTGQWSNTWTTWTHVFEATTTSFYLSIWEYGTSNDVEVFIDQVSLHEVTPGIVGANALGPDGWFKDTALDIWRQHTDSTYTKGGSFYSVKLKNTGGGNEALKWPSGIYNNESHYRRFAGRTLTMGAWVYSVSVSDNIRVSFYDNITGITSSAAAAADAWVWLEITVTVPTNITDFRAMLLTDGDANDIAYVSQPMLVFGSSIGQGNYVQPPREMVWLEGGCSFTDFIDVSLLSTDDQLINVEVQTNGKIPKGTVAYLMILDGQSTAVDKTLYFQGGSGGPIGVFIFTTVANQTHKTAGWTLADGNGDMYLSLDANFSDVTIQIRAVQVVP